jgi:DNA-binding response OmpR family regulator
LDTAQLDGSHILVVEDDYLIAQEVSRSLTQAGAVVVGPVPSVAKALRLFEKQPRIDAAVLDVNLGSENSFPVAEALREMKVPFLFSTGYNSSDITPEWRHVTVTMKPLQLADVETLLQASRQP